MKQQVEILRGFWRDSAQTACLVAGVDAVVGVPLVLFSFRIRLWTFVLLALTIVFMTVIKNFGYTPRVAILALRAWLAGKVVKRRRSMFNKTLDD